MKYFTDTVHVASCIISDNSITVTVTPACYNYITHTVPHYNTHHYTTPHSHHTTHNTPLHMTPLTIHHYTTHHSQHTTTPHSRCSDSYESMEEYELIGLMLGVAIFNSIIVDFKMPLVRTVHALTAHHPPHLFSSPLSLTSPYTLHPSPSPLSHPTPHLSTPPHPSPLRSCTRSLKDSSLSCATCSTCIPPSHRACRGS